MKRVWFCGGMMLFLLGLAIALYFEPGKSFKEISSQMLQLSEYAQAEEWEKANALIQQCQQRFSRIRKFSAAFTEHEPLEQMETLLAQLKVYQRQREVLPCATAALELSTLAQEVAESFSLQWWTFL